MPKETILEQLHLFSLGGEGIGGWLTEETDDRVFDRLDDIQNQQLTRPQLNQLLGFGHQAPVSVDFFSYYWLECPAKHPYAVEQLPSFEPRWVGDTTGITSLSHLKWGLYRLFVDGLLYFGNVRTAFRGLRTLTRQELDSFFQRKRFDTDAIKQRGGVLPLQPIPRDNRHLISEMACKSFGDDSESESVIRHALKEAYEKHRQKRGGSVTFNQLLSGELPGNYSDRQGEFKLSMEDVLEESITSEEDFDNKFGSVADKFLPHEQLRSITLNTTYLLSMIWMFT